jgi:hypothetical protein
MTQDPALDAWRQRLQRQGHRLVEPGRETVTGFTLWPDSETVVIMAIEPDPTLYPHYRQRFFLCEPDPGQVFRVMGCPIPYRTRWQDLVAGQPPSNWQDFLAGPGSWLLSRLIRFRRVIAWSDRGMPWDDIDSLSQGKFGISVPVAAAALFASSDGPEAARPRFLSTDDMRFPDAVAACVLFASAGLRDCYLADVDATEVYLAYHHDQVVVSVPDVEARTTLLRELESAAWLFTDVSGYDSSIDDDEGEPPP